ncbi:M60 family metallopeptidase [Pelagibacterium halotolerans]|uniref:M60 family metallopeptidase n=1 Tax=Pelagibacterium halotolerans TaxID=531813 RepID=UPI00384D0FE0
MRVYITDAVSGRTDTVDTAGNWIVDVSAASRITMHSPADDVVRYERVGDDLRLVLENGEVILLKNYFRDDADGWPALEFEEGSMAGHFLDQVAFENAGEGASGPAVAGGLGLLALGGVAMTRSSAGTIAGSASGAGSVGGTPVPQPETVSPETPKPETTPPDEPMPETALPDAPRNAALSPASDSGVSNADAVTNVTTPRIIGPAGSVAPGATVTLYDADGTVLGVAEAAPDGSWSIVTSALADGVHDLTVTATIDGRVSMPSPSLSVTIDTTAPDAPSMADGGLAGNAEAGSTVQILAINPDGTSGSLIATALANGTGNAEGESAWSATAKMPLPFGTQIRIIATDAAGNESAPTDSFVAFEDNATALSMTLEPNGEAHIYGENYRTSLSPASFRDVPTGIFVEKGDVLKIYLSEGQDVKAIIGSVSAYKNNANINTSVTSLGPGLNEILVQDDGLLYLSNDSMDKEAHVTISVPNNTERAIAFTLGTDTYADWVEMLAAHPDARAVELRSEHALMTVTYEQAKLHIDNPVKTLQTIDRIIELENSLAGISDTGSGITDGSGVVHQFVESQHGDWMYATNGYTGYVTNAIKALLNDQKLAHEGWGPWHELGHQHQQSAWMTSNAVEVTVNIYSTYVEYMMGNKARLGKTATDVYGNSDDTNKTWDDIGVFDKVELYNQLHWAFGTDFYRLLHHEYRLLSADQAPSTDSEKKSLFILTASKISGYDLIPFFEAWRFMEIDDGLRQDISALGLKTVPFDLSEFRYVDGDQVFKAMGNLAGLEGTYAPPQATAHHGFIVRQDEPVDVRKLVSFDENVIKSATLLDNSADGEPGETTIKVLIEDLHGNKNIIPVYGVVVPSDYESAAPESIVARAQDYMSGTERDIDTLSLHMKLLGAILDDDHDFAGMAAFRAIQDGYISIIDNIDDGLDALGTGDMAASDGRVSLSIDRDLFDEAVDSGSFLVKTYINNKYQGEVLVRQGGDDVIQYYDGRIDQGSDSAIFYVERNTSPADNVKFVVVRTIDGDNRTFEISGSVAEFGSDTALSLHADTYTTDDVASSYGAIEGLFSNASQEPPKGGDEPPLDAFALEYAYALPESMKWGLDMGVDAMRAAID